MLVIDADPLTVRGPVCRTAPATWGQDYMWEILDVLGAGGAALNARLGRLVPDGMRRGEIMARITPLFGRHEALRTRFVGDSLGAVTQAVDQEQVVPVWTCEASAPTPDAALRELANRIGKAPFDLERDVLTRVGIVERDGRPESVVLASSHILMDAQSQFRLQMELGRLLHGRPLSPEVATQPIEQAFYESSPAGRRRAAAAMRFWEETLDRFPVVIAADGASPADTPRFNHGVLTTARGFAAVRQVAAAYGVSQATVALAAVAFVLGRACGLGQYPVLVRSGNRSGAASRLTIGHFAQAAPVLVDLAPTEIGELLAGVQRAIIVALRHGLYPPAELAGLRRRLAQRRGAPVPLRMTVNYVPTWEEPGSTPWRPGPTDPQDHFDWIGGADHENLAAYCNVWERQQAISLYTDSTFLPAARIEPTLREIVAFVEYAADGHRSLRGFRP